MRWSSVVAAALQSLSGSTPGGIVPVQVTVWLDGGGAAVTVCDGGVEADDGPARTTVATTAAPASAIEAFERAARITITTPLPSYAPGCSASTCDGRRSLRRNAHPPALLGADDRVVHVAFQAGPVLAR